MQRIYSIVALLALAVVLSAPVNASGAVDVSVVRFYSLALEYLLRMLMILTLESNVT